MQNVSIQTVTRVDLNGTTSCSSMPSGADAGQSRKLLRWVSCLVLLLCVLLPHLALGASVEDILGKETSQYVLLLKDVLEQSRNRRYSAALLQIDQWAATNPPGDLSEQMQLEKERLQRAEAVMALIRQTGEDELDGVKVPLKDGEAGIVNGWAEEGVLSLRVRSDAQGEGNVSRTSPVRELPARALAALMQKAEPEEYFQNLVTLLLADQNFAAARRLLSKASAVGKSFPDLERWGRDWYSLAGMVAQLDLIERILAAVDDGDLAGAGGTAYCGPDHGV